MADGDGTALPYWLVNIRPSERPSECPESLRGLSEKQRQVLSTPDVDYHRMDWGEVKEVVRRNELGTFQRLPSDLRRYLEYMHEIKLRYGTVIDFVLKERLRWHDRRPVGPPFTFDEDVKILHNDWPYGIDRDIVHLVVWTKFELDEDEATADLSDEARLMIDGHVDKTFRSEMDAERIVWFRNWQTLKSVAAVEHFHVMLYDPPKDLVDRLTGGDVPLIARIQDHEEEEEHKRAEPRADEKGPV